MVFLYILLGLCTLAVVGAAFAAWRLVQRHMRAAHHESPVAGAKPSDAQDAERESPPTGVFD